MVQVYVLARHPGSVCAGVLVKDCLQYSAHTSRYIVRDVDGIVRAWPSWFSHEMCKALIILSCGGSSSSPSPH